MSPQTSDVPTTTRHIALARRPHGRPEPEDFRLETVGIPDLDEGQILVANHVMSVDPYMRGRMNDVKSYVPPFQLDQPLDGGAVGEVIASRSDDVPVGATVLHGLGWREHAVLDGRRAQIVDVSEVSESAYLGVMGMPGLTAYAGLMAAGEFSPGDAVFVSGAAGAVGSFVVQIARLSGASRVIGSAGSPEKVARVLELGADAAFDYHDGVLDQLEAAAPDGIDLYFDNVGGEHLEAAIEVLHDDGHIALCGAISSYNATEPPPGPRNLFRAIGKRLTMRGFIVGKYSGLGAEFRQKMSAWLCSGEVRFDETFRDGLENAPQAFVDLLDGANTGKMIVRL